MRYVLKLYDAFEAHPKKGWALFAVLVIVFCVGASRLHFSEDITDFLPFTDKQTEQWNELSASPMTKRVIVLFSPRTEDVDPGMKEECLYAFLNKESRAFTDIPMKETMASMRRYYDALPARFSEKDYARLDSQLTPDYIRERVRQLHSWMQMPMSGQAMPLWANDPLGLWSSPFIAKPDTQTTDVQLVYIDSPYGQTETGSNAAFVDSIRAEVETFIKDYPDMNIRLAGAPVIAVSNARQIRRDSIVAMVISILLITLLLYLSLRNIRSMLLIVAATTFGFLFGLGVMGVVHPRMSLIVVGISSVIVGIAVNYPLHLLVHRQYTDSTRQALAEVASPLIIGNITTVGAFLTLVPLRAEALRDLGIFAAAMLVGTILFSVLILPHCRFSTPRFDSYSALSRFINRTSAWQLDRKGWVIALLVVGTCVFGYFSKGVEFDTNLGNINYMTEQQRVDMAMLASMEPDLLEITEDGAGLWDMFWCMHRDEVDSAFTAACEAEGLRVEIFSPFTDRTTGNYARTMPEPMTMRSLQHQVLGGLSMDFDYIGLMCSLIVFVFMWLTFRRLSYALIAFVPMAVSWLWILGLMSIFGVTFNIVNIILATFIFGQGDDYTIFITEGLMHKGDESRLQQYKNGIFLSAAIMIIGIGALIVSRHPALHSLAIVTMLGMIIVVTMAYLIPPVLLRVGRWLCTWLCDQRQ